MSDKLQAFSFDGLPIRGELVTLESSWQEMLEFTEYSDVASRLLGEVIAATTLLASTVKFDGSVILQLQGEGDVSTVVAHCRSTVMHGTTNSNLSKNALAIRGLIHANDVLQAAGLSEQLGKNGRCVITIESKERYQGIVPLEGDTVAQALAAYFERSEQLPTMLWLAVNKERATGMLLQRLPEKEGEPVEEDAWSRMVQLADTLKDEEMLSLPHEELLYRLYHQETVRIHEPRSVKFDCGCSRERFGNSLRQLGIDECQEVLEEQGAISATCDFCNREYRFDQADVLALFSDSNLAAGSDKLQ